MIPIFLLSAILLPGCKVGLDLSTDPTWAINWAEVLPSETGLEDSSYHVWEFFVEGWEKKHKEEYFKCSVGQHIIAEPIACPEGAEGCVAAHQWILDPWQSDCDDTITLDPSFSGPIQVAVGLLPEDLESDDPYPGWSMGWYLGIGGEPVQPFGYVYDKLLEDGGTPPSIGWLPGQTYILWPAWAWDLQEAAE
jgi:hypothetical protein